MAIRGTAQIPSVEDLVGRPVYDAGDEKVGTVDGVYVNPSDGSARYLAVTSGWFGTKRHIVPLDDLTARGSDPDKEILAPYSKERFSEAPTFEKDQDLTLRDESAVQRHYGLESYGDAIDARQTSPAPTPEIAEAEVEGALNAGEDPMAVRTKRWGV